MIDPNLIYPGKDPDFVFPEESEMTAQEILEGVTRHRGNPINTSPAPAPGESAIHDVARKVDEIEWALQAIAEKLVELEANG